MSEVISVREYKEEGFAIIEDQVGKFVVTKHSPDIVPISDNLTIIEKYFGRKTPCVLLQSRDSMLT